MMMRAHGSRVARTGPGRRPRVATDFGQHLWHPSCRSCPTACAQSGRLCWQTAARPATRRLCVLLVLISTGCASLKIADTQPLPAAKLEPLGAERISRGGYRLDALPTSPEAPGLIVML